MTTSPGRDRPEPPADTHEELMEAGYEALVEHGYAGLSMRKIAEHSEKSHSLLQHYYGTKDGVVLAVLEYLIDGYLADVQTASVESPVEQLRSDLERSLFGPSDEASERFWAFQTALFELRLEARENDAIREQFARGEARVADRFAESVRDGVAAGAFREVDPERVALVLRDIVDTARLRRVVMDEREAPERALWAFETFVLPGLRTEA
ncbi:TetR/AcrR family transcriptional regulator [Halorubrum sp. Atlit-28R]|jgi:AcrR family transcriptional regulator|uniref:TetR/AcrR family transcriptional regulator n=1 Tax=Halorubrum sp. Atlit-28R TaxID=2282129 RepID=UPI000EF1C047|nr:TetR/AcrR family transcriptional regulator [Halorubrum sp. Atlit-28R]RLM51151.1 TetR/AcrR family transcriptional regulator [Halorubrum sp. Atlit-28R]